MTTYDRVAQSATLKLIAPTLAKPGFDLYRVTFPTGETTVRDLRQVAFHCGWIEYVGQNGETFRVEDGLL